MLMTEQEMRLRFAEAMWIDLEEQEAVKEMVYRIQSGQPKQEVQEDER